MLIGAICPELFLVFLIQSLLCSITLIVMQLWLLIKQPFGPF